MSITVLQVEADPLVSCNNNYSLQVFHIIAKECCPTGSDKSNHVQVPIGEIGIGIICGYVIVSHCFIAIFSVQKLTINTYT